VWSLTSDSICREVLNFKFLIGNVSPLQEVLSSAARTQSNDVSVLAMYDAQVGLTLSTLLYCVQVLFTDCWQLSGSLDDCS
jgi:hypothetical protein